MATKATMAGAYEANPTHETDNKLVVYNSEQHQQQEKSLSSPGNSLPDIQATGEKQQEEAVKVKKITYKWKLILRLFQIFCVIGSFGFQASANAYSGRKEVPFENVAMFYFFYAIEWVSFVWSTFVIYVYISMAFNKSNGNIKPSIRFSADTLLAIVLGIGICMQIGTYSCPAKSYDGWCVFYNTGLCFGMLLFLSYSANALWDLFSALSCLREKQQK